MQEVFDADEVVARRLRQINLEFKGGLAAFFEAVRDREQDEAVIPKNEFDRLVGKRFSQAVQTRRVSACGKD